MATTDDIPSWHRTRQAEAPESVELTPMYLTHWQVFLVKHGLDRWWQWCPVSLKGGIDTANIRWSKPRGEFLPAGETPDPSVDDGVRPSSRKVWEFSEQPIDTCDLPYLAPEL